MIHTDGITKEDSDAMQHAHTQWDVQEDNMGQIIIYTGLWEVERDGKRHYVYENDLTEKERKYFGLDYDEGVYG